MPSQRLPLSTLRQRFRIVRIGVKWKDGTVCRDVAGSSFKLVLWFSSQPSKSLAFFFLTEGDSLPEAARRQMWEDIEKMP